MLRASGFYFLLEALEKKAKAAAARTVKTRASASDDGGGDEDAGGAGGQGALDADALRVQRRLDRVEELKGLARLERAAGARLMDLDGDGGGGGGNGGGGAEAFAPAGGAPVGAPAAEGPRVGVEALREFADFSKLASGEDGDNARPKVCEGRWGFEAGACRGDFVRCSALRSAAGAEFLWGCVPGAGIGYQQQAMPHGVVRHPCVHVARPRNATSLRARRAANLGPCDRSS